MALFLRSQAQARATKIASCALGAPGVKPSCSLGRHSLAVPLTENIPRYYCPQNFSGDHWPDTRIFLVEGQNGTSTFRGVGVSFRSPLCGQGTQCTQPSRRQCWSVQRPEFAGGDQYGDQMGQALCPFAGVSRLFEHHLGQLLAREVLGIQAPYPRGIAAERPRGTTTGQPFL